MTDTKIQRLRGIAAWLDVADWTNMAANVREAANELERLGKIEAAAWRDKPTVPGMYAIAPEDDFGGFWTLVLYDQTAIDNGAPYYAGSVYGPIPNRDNPCQK